MSAEESKSGKKEKRVAYFSMEFAIHQSLKIYSGGLGFLAGSHMRSAYDLQQNMLGIGILYTNGYHDQVRNADGFMENRFIRKRYAFLKDTGVQFTLPIHGTDVHVKAYLLEPETFGTAPVYLLTTDIPENDFLSRSISFRLYDNDLAARIAQYMLLGIGGAKLLEKLGDVPDIYHLNEGHGLAVAFYLYARYKTLEEVRKRVVFTTHTPERAGNAEIDIGLLSEMGFFGNLPFEEVVKISEVQKGCLNFTVTALRLSKIANAVSQLHRQVASSMWKEYPGICDIISITNAQNRKFWMDKSIEKEFYNGSNGSLLTAKKELKRKLFEIVADQTGKLFDPDVLTIVWARRFTSYKRARLIMHDLARFRKLVTRSEKPVQVIWAGKTYPEDHASIYQFNRLISETTELKRCAVLVGYEMQLSAALKKGADIWLNTPIYKREASGTSGMTAAMNAAINFSIPDGWIPEFACDREKAYIIPVSSSFSREEQNADEGKSLLDCLEYQIIPTYYENPDQWVALIKHSINGAITGFDSNRMASEYYEKLYDYG